MLACVQIFHLGRYTEVFKPKNNGLDLLVDLAGSEGYDYESPEKGVGVLHHLLLLICRKEFQMELRKAKHRWSVRTCHFHYIS